MFVSAALLFLMEPMFAKMVLPLLGGTAAVWNTCLVFFQTVLLCGYGYAHVSAKLLSRRGQARLHLVVLIGALLTLPFRVPEGWVPPARHNPVAWLLLLLAVAVGVPFFALSASTPMLQKWFSHSGHPSASDPYFLYAASNAGSLFGLLAYPLLLEPALGLSTQTQLWASWYRLLVLLVMACAVLVWRVSDTASSSAGEPSPRDVGQDSASEKRDDTNLRRRLRWVALAFVPSSLMLGVTSELTTDIPPIPLMWVLPLSLYLLSFILVFASRPLLSHRWLAGRLPLLILAASIPVLTKAYLPLVAVIPIDLVTLFVVAMVCHGELWRRRPSAQRLTEFYLWVSVGGVLGGIFNAIIAPLVFHSLVEFPIALVLAAALRPTIDIAKDSPRARKMDYLLPVALGVCVAALILALEAEGLKPGLTLNIMIFGFSAVWCLSFGRRPLRFALGLAALMLASGVYTGHFGRVLRTERSFFGVYRIANDDASGLRVLFHGSTVHGIQSLEPARACDPLAYYTRSGPIGQVFAAYTGSAVENQVAIVGLGAGALAAYQSPGGQFTFYEIDPLVERIARDRRYFTYLSNCAPQARVVLGDARLSLLEAPDHAFGIIVLDAFSGDCIPTHLVTREALRIYLSKLATGGLLAFHISNRYLDLHQVLGNLAHDAGVICLLNLDTATSEDDTKTGKYPSVWMVMARKSEDLQVLSQDARWMPVSPVLGARVWTDDFSNVLSIIKFH
jgi:SAM-dependent methyltransferase